MARTPGADEPRGPTRGLAQEAREELEREQAQDSGGQEHASRADREGIPAERRPVEAATRDVSRATEEQSDADALRVPRGDPGTGAGGSQAGGTPAARPSESPEE